MEESAPWPAHISFRPCRTRSTCGPIVEVCHLAMASQATAAPARGNQSAMMSLCACIATSDTRSACICLRIANWMQYAFNFRRRAQRSCVSCSAVSVRTIRSLRESCVMIALLLAGWTRSTRALCLWQMRQSAPGLGDTITTRQQNLIQLRPNYLCWSQMRVST